MTVTTSTMPWIIAKSRLAMELMSSCPRPGMLKTVSTTMAPERSDAMDCPTAVRMGNSALRRAWTPTTTRSLMPFATRVLMKFWSRTSAMAARVILAISAACVLPSARAGRTR